MCVLCRQKHCTIKVCDECEEHYCTECLDTLVWSFSSEPCWAYKDCDGVSCPYTRPAAIPLVDHTLHCTALHTTKHHKTYGTWSGHQPDRPGSANAALRTTNV